MRPEASPTVDPDRAQALALVPVSRETEERFAVFVELLRRWQGVKNLVAPSAFREIWTRHVADSAQIVSIVPQARRWLDMGSGAGFPGLVVAMLLRDQSGVDVHLVESNGRKCAFLREAIRETGAAATVHHARVEDVTPGLPRVDAVSARALAPLPELLRLATVPLDAGAAGVFLKSAGEIGEGPRIEGRRVEVLPSLTSPSGRIVLVPGARPSP